MKAIVALTVCAALMLTSCDELTGGKLKKENASLAAELEQRNAELDEMMGLFNDINEGFRQINEMEDRVDLQRGAIAEGSKTAKEQVASDMAFIQKRLQENKEEIERLQELLRKSKNNSAQLQRAIENLTAQVAAQSQQIEELKTELAAKDVRISELDTAVSNLTAENAELTAANQQQASTMAQQNKALHTAYYAIGTKKELKEQNILDGSDVLTQSDMNMSYFTEIDIRDVKLIPLYSKKVELLTSHPESSYQLEQDPDTKYYSLHIYNADSFWSASKYLVVRVK